MTIVSIAPEARFSLPALVPGLLLTGAIAAAAFALRHLPGLGVLSPMILAITIGIGLRNLVGTPHQARPGIAFALRRILRLAIILLGLQLTAAQVVQVGAGGIAVLAATCAATFMFTLWLGRRLGVERKLAELIAAGTSICGASAIFAVNTVTEAKDEDAAYAVACVTIFGTLAMFLYPLIAGLMQLSPHAYGLWSGASIHEIAQVVAAAYQQGQEAGDFGTIAKLSRVAMLAPLVLVLGILARRRQPGRHSAKKAPMPWFVIGFIAMVGLNSVVVVPPELKSWLVSATAFMLSMALAAMGLETSVARLRAKGPRPLLLGFLAFLFIAGFALMAVELTDRAT